MVVEHHDKHELSRMSVLVLHRPDGEISKRDFGGDVVEVDTPFGEDLLGFFFVSLNHIYNIYTL